MHASCQPLTIAAAGCGSRSRIYASIAASMGDSFSITAGADPLPERRAAMKKIANNPHFTSFASAQELLEEDKLADILIIGTQDDYHFLPAKKALEKGYDLLLEKPAAQTPSEIIELAHLAEKLGRKILLCFVLRYTPFYSKVKEIVESGLLGDIVSLHATEGVEAWHQAHSFVRGHWSVTAKSTPMIVAKCCHDTDYISWLMDSPCTEVSSMGNLFFFHKDNAPKGATLRCTDPCPHSAPQGGTCFYDAHGYLSSHNRWLSMVYPHPTEYKNNDVLQWLKTSPWGRCVFACDNDVVDHQTVSMLFKNGATASLKMTAFDRGRSLEIFGTKASLRGGEGFKQRESDPDIIIRTHTGERTSITLPQTNQDGYQGHGGGDYGLVRAMEAIFRGKGDQKSLIAHSIQSHLIGFAAEASRLQNGQAVSLSDFWKNAEKSTSHSL